MAGTWYSLAMAASDISLLDAQSAPLRVYVEELKPTPKGDLEILLQKWWASPPGMEPPLPRTVGPPGGGVQAGPGPQGRGRGLGVSWNPWSPPKAAHPGLFFF